MNEHSVQVVISEPGGRQVRVSWQAPAGSSAQSPLVLQVASASTPTAPRHETFPPPMPPSAASIARHESFPPPMWPYAASGSGSSAPPSGAPRLETFPPAMTSSASSAPPALSIELRWSEPPPAAVLAPPHSEPAPRSEPAPLAVAWAAEKLRQRHLATATESVRPRARTTAR